MRYYSRDYWNLCSRFCANSCNYFCSEVLVIKVNVHFICFDAIHFLWIYLNFIIDNRCVRKLIVRYIVDLIKIWILIIDRWLVSTVWILDACNQLIKQSLSLTTVINMMKNAKIDFTNGKIEEGFGFFRDIKYKRVSFRK